MNRRTFVQSATLVLSVLTFLPSLILAEERRRGGVASAGATTLPVLVDPKDPAAKAVSYVESNKEIKDANLKVERTGVKFEAQNCKNCAFYVSDKETTISGKKAAPCQMPFAAGKYVVAPGWCSTWAKKNQ